MTSRCSDDGRYVYFTGQPSWKTTTVTANADGFINATDGSRFVYLTPFNKARVAVGDGIVLEINGVAA